MLSRGKSCMKIATGKQLSHDLRAMAHGVRRRLWISSPYVGGWNAAKCVIDIAWQENPHIRLRLLTDIKNDGWLDRKTIEKIATYGKIKDLRGLHAKVFIIDDEALITSANLTDQAFTRRYEAGVFLNAKESARIIEIFEDWWKAAKKPPSGWIAKLKPAKQGKGGRDEPGIGNHLKKLWSLPQPPQEPADGNIGDWDLFRKHYEDFAEIYVGVQRLWPKVPLYLETDGFLSFLFHKAAGRPPKAFAKPDRPPRRLTANKRLAEIQQQAKAFAKYIGSNKKDGASRINRWRNAAKLLGQNRIQHLTRPEVKSVVGGFNCLQRRSYHKDDFLAKNNLKVIRKEWAAVLHPNGSSRKAAMDHCVRSLVGFGKSSVQELIGWYDPLNYPIRNSVSNAGLRYFGYDVKVR